jgi:hypothetical protein
MGSFMAAQVVADLKNTKFLGDAEDYWSWAAPGPGSLNGLEACIGRRVVNVAQFNIEINALYARIKPYLKPHVPMLHMQDLQNCLCEFSKFERTLWGRGRPRSHYPGA